MSQVRRTYVNSGTKSFVPEVGTNTVECLGPGGGGGGGSVGAGGGGGGGAYASSVLSLAPGTSYQVVVGNGGTGGAAAGAGAASATPTTFSSNASGFAAPARTIPITSGGISNAATASLIMTPTTPGASAITFLSAVGITGNGGSNQASEPALPSGLQAGDVVVACVYTDGGEVPTPSGWTEAVHGVDGIYRVAYRIIASSAESSTVVGWSPDGNLFGLSYAAYRGVATVTVGETTSFSASSNAASQVSFSATSTAPQGTIRTFAISARSGTTTNITWNSPAGVTEVYDTTFTAAAGRSVYQAYEVYGTVTASTLVRGAAGAGGAAGGLGAGAAGAGGTTANSIGTTTTAGSTGSGSTGGSGAAPLGTVAGTTWGDGGNGGGALTAGQAGNAGAVRIAWALTDATGVASADLSYRVRVIKSSTGVATGNKSLLLLRTTKFLTAVGVPSDRQRTRATRSTTGVGTIAESQRTRKTITATAIGTSSKRARVRSNRVATAVGSSTFSRKWFAFRKATAMGVATPSFKRVTIFVRKFSLFGIGTAKGRIALDMDDLPTGEGGGGNTYVTPLFIFDD